MKIKLILLATLILGNASVLLLANSSALAQSHAAQATPEVSEVPQFSMSPVGDYPDGYIADVEVLPGSSVELTLVITNTGSVPADLSTFKVNALSGQNGGYVSGLQTDEPVGMTTWVDYPAQLIDLDPGEQREISFTVSVPTDAMPGQHIAGIVVETAKPLPIPGMATLNHTMGRAMSVSVLVPGDLTYSFELGEPEVVDRMLTVPIVNTGNYLVRPAGELTVLEADGSTIVSAPIEMGSVYAGRSTTIGVPLPEQMPPDEYTLNLTMTDPKSGATDSLDAANVTVPDPVDPTGVSVGAASIDPNADEIVFANVDITLNNGGQQIPASDVTLEVLHDGEQVDSFPLATNQVLLNGENTYTTRYIPAEMWEPGTYTFRIVVSAVDPNGGQETILLTEDLDAEIVVP